MTVVFWLVYGMLGAGALLALVRLARGPSLLDRVVATDILLVIISAGLAVYAALRQDPTVVPVLVVVSLLAFVGSVSVARYVGGMLVQAQEDSTDVGEPVIDPSSVSDVVAVVLMLIGSFLCLTAGLGLVRFPDVLSRMHAGTKPQVLGVLLIMIAGALRLQGWSATWMLLLVAAFQLLTAPVSAHMVSRVAYRRRHVRRDLLLVDELRSGESQDSVYRGDEPADAPPEQ